METIKIGVITGSLRKGSFSRQVAQFVSGLMPDNFEMIPFEIGNLAIYNQDFDDEDRTPKEWIVFREKIQAMDGYLFVTPEYNRSFTPVLKNALDIGSRPYGCNAWDGKPGAIISVSIGKMGGFGANHALRQALVFLNILLLQQPEAYVGEVARLFNNNGECVNDSTGKFFAFFSDAFAQWILKLKE
jgi:chromate reductase